MVNVAVTNLTSAETDWTLKTVLASTGGTLVNSSAKDRSFSGVNTDTRKLIKGELFVALNGKNYNGSAFVPLAIAKGAHGVVVNKSDLPLSLSNCDLCPIIRVNDSLQALGDLAAYRRRLMENLRVVAITGSSGKTTVKEMTASIVASHFHLIKTEGNFNNLVGLPLSILPVTQDHQVAILEMGMNNPREIARLAEITNPDISCIINIQEAHLEGLKDIHGVAAAKMELFDNSPASSTLIINLDDPIIRSKTSQFSHQQVSYAANSPEATVRLSNFTGSAEHGSRFILQIGEQKKEVTLHTIGFHNATNALAAAAIAHSMGLNLEQICQGLEKFIPYEKRFQVTTLASGIQVINDCYNANPSSMQAALETLQQHKSHHRSMAALGDMLELGNKSKILHRELGRTAAESGLNFLAVTGSFSNIVVDAAREAGMMVETARSFANHSEMADWFSLLMKEGQLNAEDWILIKGSRSMAMEKILQKLKD